MTTRIASTYRGEVQAHCENDGCNRAATLFFVYLLTDRTFVHAFSCEVHAHSYARLRGEVGPTFTDDDGAGSESDS